MSKKRVAILISGRGSNMTALIEAARVPDYPAEIVGVLANKPDAGGINTAAGFGIATAVRSHTDYASKAEFDAALHQVLTDWGAEFVCLAGFMRILSAEFTGRWMGRMINIHPSLLPSFKGLETHRQALDAGVALHGCTVHFVTPGMDEGQSLMQAAVPVLPGDTPESLSDRILLAEHQIYPQALAALASGKVKLEDGKVVRAESGKIPPAMIWPVY